MLKLAMIAAAMFVAAPALADRGDCGRLPDGSVFCYGGHTHDGWRHEHRRFWGWGERRGWDGWDGERHHHHHDREYDHPYNRD